jgi:hypothetical protein
MSKSPRAASGASTPTKTTLRASAKPLDAGAFGAAPEPGEIPPHTEPFKAFDWMPEGGRVDPATRALVNDAINICTGAALALRIVEQCQMVGDFSPVDVVLADGLAVEQPDAPYLSPGDCAALSAFAAAALGLLADRAHLFASTVRS